MTTYTIAWKPGLVATVPDGEDAIAAAADKARAAGTFADFDSADLMVVDGLTLTNVPKETDEVVWHDIGRGLVDTDGNTYCYAVARP
jgi:hypothetical protein